MDPVTLDFVTLDVFTTTRFLGNPLAVVFVPASQRSRLDQQTKQRIAREFNLSETVFLHTLDDEATNGATVTTRGIDIFTTEEELPFAGHPTIGSAYLVLRHLGWSHVDTLRTRAGPIRIQAPSSGDGKGQVRAAIPHAVHVHRQTLGGVLDEPATTEVAKDAIRYGLSTDPDIRAAELAAPVVSIVKGMSFVLVRLPSLEHLARVGKGNRLDFGQVPGLLDQGEWHGGFTARYYYVPLEEEGAGGSGSELAIRTRMVELGFEDPATGSAACTLASYLAVSGRKTAEETVRFAITQGVEMGRKSDISVDVAVAQEEGEARVRELYLGGTAAVVMSGSISV
jgi:pre-mRNA-processing factor 19